MFITIFFERCLFFGGFVRVLEFGIKHSLTQFCVSVIVRQCAFLFLVSNKQLNNCFWIRVALIRVGWWDLMQADLLI